MLVCQYFRTLRYWLLLFDAFLLAGVYQSLVAGWWVSRQDVDEAVNNICEELAPIEIDITNFILSSCRLTHQMLDISALLAASQQTDISQSPSTAASSCDDEQVPDSETSTRSEERFAMLHISDRLYSRPRFHMQGDHWKCWGF